METASLSAQRRPALSLKKDGDQQEGDSEEDVMMGAEFDKSLDSKQSELKLSAFMRETGGVSGNH